MIYNSWAFKENEGMKAQSNREEYNKLKEKYRITRYGDKSTNLEDYDVVVGVVGYGYANTQYEVYKNAPRLSTMELALICDDGNLCFGYRYDGNIVIYTD